jgi:hypothetical protein
MKVQRDFLLLVTMAAAVATPAWGQTAPAVAPGKSGPQSAASIPDVSEMFTGIGGTLASSFGAVGIGSPPGDEQGANEG